MNAVDDIAALTTVGVATTVTTVDVIMPEDVDDPRRPSGGNTYDRRICLGLKTIGWFVRERRVAGSWPRSNAAARATLTTLIAGIPDDNVVLIDGLIASSVPEVLVPEASRLRLVVLAHMPLGLGRSGDEVADVTGLTEVGGQERAVLSAAAAVITTSRWTRRWLLDRYGLEPGRVHVAEPGVDAADLAPGTAAGGELLCVAAVTPGKGHDVLLEALADISEMPWRCICVGSLTRDPGFIERLTSQARDIGIGDRVHFTGPLAAADLGARYAAADVLVLASRAETYGMVVTEALARGLPVVATEVGGLPEALGQGADGSRPGLLVPPGDPQALAAALRCWLSDGELRRRLRQAAEERRVTLSEWAATSARISHVLAEVTA